MEFELKLKNCITKQKEFIYSCDKLHDAIMNELQKSALSNISDYLKMEKSYVKQTATRGIGTKSYPRNFKPLIRIALAIIEIEKKRIALKKISRGKL